MRIEAIDAIPVRARAAENFRTSKSGDGQDWWLKVLVRIQGDNGLVGYGEGSPSAHWNGDTVEGTVLAIRRFTAGLLGCNPIDIGAIHRIMDRSLPLGYSSAKCAIDIACYDLAGKYLDVPIYELLGGGRRDRLHVLRGLGIADGSAAVADLARSAERAGHRLIKVKIGTNPVADVERVAAVRAAVSPGTLVSADANEGYDQGEALRVCAQLERYDLLCVEQPLARSDLSGHARLRAATSVPIMLDESVMSPAEMLSAIRHDAADYVFLKLDNYGGIYRSAQVATVARAGNVVPIPGGSGHTGIGVAALAHLAVALDLTLPGGYNGPVHQIAPETVFVKEGGGLVYEGGGGVLRVPDGPGLGIDVDEEAIAKYRFEADFMGGRVERTVSDSSHRSV